MIYGGGPGALSLLLGVLGSILSVVAVAIGFVVVAGLLVLLVRFLWFGTRAAQLYLVRNGDSARFSWPVPPVGGTTETPQAETTEAPPGADGEPRAPRKPKSPPSA